MSLPLRSTSAAAIDFRPVRRPVLRLCCAEVLAQRSNRQMHFTVQPFPHSRSPHRCPAPPPPQYIHKALVPKRILHPGLPGVLLLRRLLNRQKNSHAGLPDARGTARMVHAHRANQAVAAVRRLHPLPHMYHFASCEPAERAAEGAHGPDGQNLLLRPLLLRSEQR